MPKNIIKIAGIFSGAFILIFFASTLMSSNTKTSENTSAKDTTTIVADSISSYQQEIIEHYKIFSIPTPENINFAGEKLPIGDIDVREKLDRELHVNTYWQSNTFLYHKRAARWFPFIESILKKNEVPDDFKYLALIESGLDNVVSPAGAAGFWQFMKGTGESYGLEINKYVDERYHVEKATNAACKYLLDAKKQFGTWTLAAASYNMGKGGVSQKLKEQNVKGYYDLYLNSETSRYIYRIVATKYIHLQPKNYGFNIRSEDLYPSYQTINLEVDTTINNLVGFAQERSSNYKVLKILNPWLRDLSLPNKSGKKYTIQIPQKDFELKPNLTTSEE